jgi:hypothetical protein
MPLTPNVNQIGATDCLSTSGAVRQAEPVDGIVSRNKSLLEGVVRVSRGWGDQIPVNDPQRQRLTRVGSLAEDLLRNGDYSSTAMTTARALLCVNCRRLNASQGKCFGQALDRCLLLNGVT